MVIEWEDSAIGVSEDFIYRKIFRDRTIARAPGTSLVSLGLDKVYLYDELGDIRPNIWFWFILRSGKGKTPVINWINDVLYVYNPKAGTELKMPRGSTAAITEWIVGSKVDREDEKKKYEPHLTSFLLEDEATKRIATLKFQYNAGQGEFLSQLWDSSIEGYITRGSGFEGNARPYVALFMAASEKIYRLLGEYSFAQGLPYRPFWLTSDNVEVRRADYGKFFFPDTDGKDVERVFVINKVVETIQTVSNYTRVLPDIDATKVLIDYKYDLECRAQEADLNGREIEGGILRKAVINSFKLAVIYAANCESVSGGFLMKQNRINIRGEDAERAREDTEKYNNCFLDCMKRLAMLSREKPYTTHLSDEQWILNIIDRNYPEDTPKSKFHGHGYPAKTINMLLMSLIEAETIEMELIQGVKGGRPKMVYRRVKKDGV